MAEKREEAMKGKLESAKNEFADFQIGTKKTPQGSQVQHRPQEPEDQRTREGVGKTSQGHDGAE